MSVVRGRSIYTASMHVGTLLTCPETLRCLLGRATLLRTGTLGNGEARKTLKQ